MTCAGTSFHKTNPSKTSFTKEEGGSVSFHKTNSSKTSFIKEEGGSVSFNKTNPSYTTMECLNRQQGEVWFLRIEPNTNLFLRIEQNSYALKIES